MVLLLKLVVILIKVYSGQKHVLSYLQKATVYFICPSKFLTAELNCRVNVTDKFRGICKTVVKARV